MGGANSCSLRGTTIPILSGPVVHIGATSVDGDDDEVQVHDSVQSNSRNFDSNWSWD